MSTTSDKSFVAVSKEDLAGTGLTEEQLKTLKKQVSEALSRDRYTLLMKFPFAGNILMRMNLIPVRDVRCRTACTDGKDVYFDMDFYSRLKGHERVFVLAHEVWHAIMLHLVRCQSRLPEIFNIATDMEVNYLLSRQPNYAEFKAPSSCLMPPSQLEGKNAETIYEWLLRQQSKKQQKQQNGGKGKGQQQKNQSSSQNGQKSQNGGQQNQNDSDDDGSEQDDSQQNDNSSYQGQGADGKDSGRLEGQFDSHIYEGHESGDQDENEGQDGQDRQDQQNGQGNGDQDQDSQGSNGQGQDGQGNGKSNGKGKGGKGGKPGKGLGVKDQWGNVGFDKDFRPSLSKDFANEMREAVISEAQKIERMQGTLPAGLDGIIKRFLKPEINWKEQLAKFVTQCYNGSRKWLPPNRRHVYNDVYLQSRRSEKIRVCCLIDTSGSCWGDQVKFFGELNGLLKSFGSYVLHCVMCDADVQRHDIYDDENPFPLDNPKDFEVGGGGGSDFRPAFSYIRKNITDVDVMIGMTDGYIDVPHNGPSVPMLWVLTKDGDEDFCPWGQKMKFKNNSYDEGVEMPY